ncbi:MAG: hypothetical protein FWD48_11270 [Oscillospiraceae bacterium]|nr:hypothetical protein [Oscillospiraceae bacterium]
MSAKEQLQDVLDFIGEKEAMQILVYVKESFALKPKSWEDIEEDEPSPDEVLAFEEYRVSKNQ